MGRRTLGALALAGAATLAWSLAEAHAFTLRRVTVPVLPHGSEPLRILHLSDLHLTPGQRDKIAWVRELGAEPVDLVVTTGDNLAHSLAVPPLLGAYEPLMRHPGAFVFGSNDYFAPRPKNPFAYFGGPSLLRDGPRRLPTEDLRAGLMAGGWVDLNNARADMTINGLTIRFVGLDDPHIGRDALPAGRSSRADLTLGVVHAPYRRALGALIRGRSRPRLGWPHARWPSVCAGHRRARHELRSRHPSRQRPKPLARRRREMVARVGRSWHQSVCTGPARVQARGHRIDPG